MSRSINALSSNVNTVVENSGGLSIIEIVERGPQGIPGDSTLAAVSTWKADSEYTLNQKVSYLDAIYNADVDIVPVGTLPTDEAYWSNISGTGKDAESVIPVRGGDVPLDYDETSNYVVDDRVSINNKEYRCINVTPIPSGVFDPLSWNEVSTQNNETRIAALELDARGSVINEYSFTQTTNNTWVVSNAGATQADFDSATREFFRDGIKLRKNAEVLWVSDTEVAINLTSVANENFLDIRVTTTATIAPDPTEAEFSQTIPANGVWTVSGIGDSLEEFNSANIQIFYNGAKLRKGAQAIWVSPTELRIIYTSVDTEDYLVIRNDV